MAPPPSKKAAAPADKAEKPVPGSKKEKKEGHEEMVGRPDQAVYNKEQDAIRAEIEVLQGKLNEIKNKIALATNSPTSGSGSPDATRRSQLKAELDGLRGQQAETKGKRGKILDELKKVREDVGKKIKDLQASKSKMNFKTVDEVDDQIKNLEKQVESGSLTIAAEKRALNEITTLKRSRKNVEAFGDIQESIDADKARCDALSAQLDDPASKAVGDRFDAIKAELGELQKEGDILYESRNKLFEERREIMAALDEVHGRRKEASSKYKEAQDVYWNKVTEERARKAEKFKADRKASDDAKRLETATRLREEARIPAYGSQIEDCQTIIDFLTGKSSVTPGSAAPLQEKKVIEGVQKLEGRKVEVDETLIVRKKKGDDDEAYFGGGGKKNKSGGSKKSTPAPAAFGSKVTAPPPDKEKIVDGKLNLPFSVLSAILALSIPPPTSSADVPRTVEDLKTKKSWFEANNDKVTREREEKAEKEIRRLEAKTSAGEDDSTADAEEKAETAGAKEPQHTPAVGSNGAVKVEGAVLPTEPSIAEGEEEEKVAALDEELKEVVEEEKKVEEDA
ncbi:hypothetical protein BDY24DRAFT_378516 [Mrakia frigida]|uniref:Bfr1p n=1 Tax=Mrakia frigida TaxID=29902 RepID=UPI003FCC1B52